MSLKNVKIESKKSIGVLPVYDICVPEVHHYLLDSGVVSHNSGFIYASSIVVAMNKLKLKVDEDGNKTSKVHGIRSVCKIMKTRYAKPFETIEVEIPYTTGMSPYSGLVTMFESKNVLTREGNSLVYTTKDGVIIKQFRKAWERNEQDGLSIIMNEWKDEPAIDLTSEESDGE